MLRARQSYATRNVNDGAVPVLDKEKTPIVMRFGAARVNDGARLAVTKEKGATLLEEM
jgi:hypothetical protein